MSDVYCFLFETRAIKVSSAPLIAMNLKDENNRWVEYLTISEQLWNTTKIETRWNIISLLDSANALIEKIKTPADHPNSMAKVCAGLYTQALEEYGKLLYLLECTPANGQVTIEY